MVGVDDNASNLKGYGVVVGVKDVPSGMYCLGNWRRRCLQREYYDEETQRWDPFVWAPLF